MTHNDIYIKFMIEYDKAGALTSYPSLTEYEVATFLDKAYNALIAQKVTGNNYRRAGFEADLKSVEDIAPLVVEEQITTNGERHNEIIDNRLVYNRPEDMLYFVNMYLTYKPSYAGLGMVGSDQTEGVIQAYDPAIDHPIVNGTAWDHGNRVTTELANLKRLIPTKLVSHGTAEKFMSSTSNIPWIKTPVCYLLNDKICVLYDLYMFDKQLDSSSSTIGLPAYITYIKKPNPFAKDLSKFKDYSDITYFYDGGNNLDEYKFECNSTVAEELVSLAVSFALENVESQRLNSKLNMRGLEA